MPSVAAARDAARRREAENEYRRLLYVAMTRAADRLIICGADGADETAGGLLVRSGARAARRVPGRGRRQRRESLRYRKTPASAVARDRSRRGPGAKRRRREFPAWLRQPAPTEAPLPVPLSPSSAFDEDISLHRTERRLRGRSAKGAGARPPGASADAIAARYSGRAPQRCRASAILPTPPRTFAAAERAAMAQQVLAILDDRELCRDFCAGQPRRGADRRPHCARGTAPDPGRRPGRPPGGHRRFGADRRLQDRPRRSATSSARRTAYVTQLALYRAVLARRLSRTKPCARRWSSPMGRSSWNFRPRRMDAALAKLAPSP